jgi:hypothetical protein
MEFYPNAERLVAKHRSSGLIVDTNLMLLFVIGVYDSRRIEGFKRTARYTKSDYKRLRFVMERFQNLWTTPNILTEVDNLGRQLPTNEWASFALAAQKSIKLQNEIAYQSSVLSGGQHFARVGLTDSATLLLANQRLLLSDDLALYVTAIQSGFDAINFNHLRFNQ